MKTLTSKLFRIAAIALLILSLAGGCKEDEPEEDVQKLPELSTLAVEDIKSASATSGGMISSDGGASITARGLVWAGYENPTTANNEGMSTDGSGDGSFTGELTNLMPYTTYYVRAYATNIKGTAYGNQLTFETLPEGAYGTVTDADGNVYWTVKIGDTEWMAQNLRTTKFADGTAIPTGLTDEEWLTTDQPAYREFPWDDTLMAARFIEPVIDADFFGYFYNAWVVHYGHPCPEGWYVPSAAQWDNSGQALANYFGIGEGLVGDYLKSCRQVNSPLGGGCKTNWHPRWDECNTAYGRNKLLFLALPAGYFTANGSYGGLGTDAYFWTSTWSQGYTQRRNLVVNKSAVYSGSSPNGSGYAVRCFRPLIKE